MPDPDRLLKTLAQATRIQRGTPGRKGWLLCLQDAAEVLIAGDLHGHVDNFRRILVRANLAGHPGRHLVFQELIHSPFRYLQGGDKSHQLLDLLAALTCQFPGRVHFLLGNHEVAQWHGQQIAKGDLDQNQLFEQGVADAYKDRASEIYRAYLDLLAAGQLAIRTPNRVFLCHSVPTAGKLESFDLAILEKAELNREDVNFGGSVHSLVWGRDTRASTVQAFLTMVDADLVVTGHIPCESGYEVPNPYQLILDAMKVPPAICLFPANRPITQEELLAGVELL